MAEGGIRNDRKPPKPEDPLAEYELEDICSIELLFARDLVTYVMRRRIRDWDFSDRYGGSSPVTPFSYIIRNAIEHYLIKEDINMYFLFAKGFSRLPLDYQGFIIAVSVIVDSVFPNVHTPNDLMRLMALISQYTVLGYKRGIHMAPHYALATIQNLLYRYISGKKLRSLDFFTNLNYHAQNMTREKPLVPHELIL